MISINKTININLSTLIKKLTHCTLLILLVTLGIGCSSSTDNKTETPENNEYLLKDPIKGPYEIAADEKVPSVVSYREPKDSLRFINEPIFKFNDVVYRYVLSPLANGYVNVVPKPVDNSIGNFFNNLREPLFAINHLFQGEVTKSGKSIARFLVNSTVGLLGLFDPANSMMDLEPDRATFGETLASYGVGQGPYIVIPLLGPSDLRDIASISFNYFAHPLNFIHDEKVAMQLLIADGNQAQIPNLTMYPRVLTDVDKPYEFIRNLYMQNMLRDGQDRRNEIYKTQKNHQPLVNSDKPINSVEE